MACLLSAWAQDGLREELRRRYKGAVTSARQLTGPRGYVVAFFWPHARGNCGRSSSEDLMWNSIVQQQRMEIDSRRRARNALTGRILSRQT